ncbi:ester cyclase [Foetidibacter luteolus]|uniref:ester cyclase n=1 Tax=Foetidibacter luteolus TaxID=2608880 RepID=UPI00129AAE0C|nr:ester cyclase [Foetidibacter luteolus]
MRNLQNTLISRWYQQVWNQGIEKSIDDMLDDDVTVHGISDDVPLKGTNGFKGFYHDFKSQFTDIDVTVEDVIAEDDIECGRCSVKAVHKATGKPVSFTGIAMVRIKDGKITEGWNNFDFLKMNQQLGMKLVAQ